MINEIKEAVADMQSKVNFDKKKHIYTTKDGQRLQGVSTVSSIVPKDWLAPWGAKEAVKFLGYSDYEGDESRALEVLKLINKMGPQEFIAFLKEAKGAASRKSKTALVNGKLGHEWLENFVKAKLNKTELPEIPAGTLERPLRQFLEWEKANVQEWILSEELVCYIEKCYAGTLDGVAAMKIGKLSLIDFKFSNHFSADYKLQCAGYQATFEPYGINLDERIIIRLPKTLEIEEWDKENFKYFMKPNNIEVKLLDNTNYGWDRDMFFHALPLKGWINAELKRGGDDA